MQVNTWRVLPALLGAVLVVLTPRVSHGGLADDIRVKAEAEAAVAATSALTNAVMKEIEKKIADAVGEKPISEADKASITKKLTGMAKPVVKKFINGAASGELPKAAELVDTVMKEVLPQVDGLAASVAKVESNQSVAVPSPVSQPTHSSPSPSAPSLPVSPVATSRVVAVCVTGSGDVKAELKKSVGTGILNALVGSKRYTAVGNSEAFLTEIDALQSVKIDNAVYDTQISEIGVKFGVGFVCVAEITPTSDAIDAIHVLTRMIDVQTTEAVSVGNAFSPLKSDDDIAVVSGVLVKKMTGERIEPPSLVDVSGLTPSPPPPPPLPLSSQSSQSSPPLPPSPQPFQPPPPVKELTRTSMTGFSLGYGLSQDTGSKSEFLLLGFVHSRPISRKIASFNFESNLWLGMGEYTYRYYDGSHYDYAKESINMFGANVPLTVSFQQSVFFVEVGAFGDVFFVDSEVFYNGGVVVGAGIAFDKKRARRYFYRYNSGFKYGTQAVGMWWLF